MNYSNSPSMVRVDFFKESGKWYATEQMESLHYDGKILIHDVFARSLKSAFPNNYHDITAVCLEPYHECAHPLMMRDWINWK